MVNASLCLLTIMVIALLRLCPRHELSIPSYMQKKINFIRFSRFPRYYFLFITTKKEKKNIICLTMFIYSLNSFIFITNKCYNGKGIDRDEWLILCFDNSSLFYLKKTYLFGVENLFIIVYYSILKIQRMIYCYMKKRPNKKDIIGWWKMKAQFLHLELFELCLRNWWLMMWN